MKKALLAVLVLLLIVAGFSAWLWKLGAPPTLAASVARLDAIEGTVETRTEATGPWVTANNGQLIQAGTHIRTGADGSVTFTVSGVSQTRLSTSTEISIDTLVLPQSTDTKSQTGITLLTGRTWSRIVRLLELDSSYTVTTDDVVATVRGTAFETARLPGQETWIAVYDGKVKAADRVMEKGTGMMRKAKGTWQFVSSTKEVPQNQAWIETNVETDKVFLKETQEQIKQDLTEQLPKGYAMFGGPAERLHMALTPEAQKPGLADQYLGRRLTWANVLEEQGDTKRAEEELGRVKREMQAWTQQTPPEVQDRLFPRTMLQGSVLYHDAPTEPANFFLKETIDTRKALEPAIQLRPIDSDRRMLQEPAQPLQPLVRPPTEEQLQIQTQPPASSTVFVPSGVLQERPREQPLLTAQPTDRPTDQPIPVNLILFSPRTMLRFREAAPIMATINYSNGSRRDVTLLVTLTSSDPSLGLVLGNTFQANDRPGRVQVTASYRENGVSVIESLTFDIQP